MARAVSGFSKIQKPLIESGAMKYKPRNRPGEGPADAGFVLRETRLYRRKENGVLQEHLGQDTRHDQDQRAADARCDVSHLYAFLEHGEIEISNNQVENAIRPFVVGRKGWLFADTLQGAEASAIIYSLMETAKANSLRPDDDLLHLLSILPERAERNKDFEVDDLLPWSEEMKSWFSAVRVLGTTAFLYRGIIER